MHDGGRNESCPWIRPWPPVSVHTPWGRWRDLVCWTWALCLVVPPTRPVLKESVRQFVNVTARNIRGVCHAQCIRLTLVIGWTVFALIMSLEFDWLKNSTGCQIPSASSTRSSLQRNARSKQLIGTHPYIIYYYCVCKMLYFFIIFSSWLFCHFDIDTCIYSTCTFFDCQADFDDNVQRRELVHFYGV